MRIIFTILVSIMPMVCALSQESHSFTQTALMGEGKWSSDFAVPGIAGTISVTATDGSNLYVGGKFIRAGSIAANSIAMWDGNQWHAMGEGPENGVGGEIPSVEAMAFVDGKLFIGGQFSTAGGLEVNGLAWWDGSQWNRMGSDSTNGVRRKVVVENDTLMLRGFPYALLAHNNKIYVGGNFQYAGNSPTEGVAIWNIDSSRWETPEHGITRENDDPQPTIFCLAAHENNVYAGGTFQFEPLGIAARNIARWDGTSWSSLGEAAGYILDMKTDDDGNLYAAGFFASEADSTGGASGIGIWNGTNWTSLNGPADYKSQISRLGFFKNELYAGGSFLQDYVQPNQNLARWNGTDWQIIEGLARTYNTLFSAGISSIEGTEDNLYVTGYFSRAGDTYAVNIAQFEPETSAWKLLNDGNANQGIHDGYIMALEQAGDTLYAGGEFTVAGGTLARSIAKWTGSEWKALGYGTDEYNGIRGQVFTILADSSEVYAGGRFDNAGGEATFHVARWDGSKWWPVGLGVGGLTGAHVKALAKSGDYLYVGGYFAVVGDEENYEIPANSIARFNLKTSRWETFGSGIEYNHGVPGTVNDMEWHGDTLFVGGEFYLADGMDNENLAALIGGKWASADNNHDYGIRGRVNKIKAIGDDLYIGGILKYETDDPSHGILKWENGAWETVGDPFTAGDKDVFVNDIVEFDSGFVAGGLFTLAGDLLVNNMAYFDGQSWNAIGGGVLPGVSQLAATAYKLYVAGPTQIYAGGELSMGLAELAFEPPVIVITDQNVYDKPHLISVYPNPLLSVAMVSYTLPDAGNVHLEIYDSQGRQIRSLVKEYKTAGQYSFTFDASGLSTGLYFCRMTAGEHVETVKISKR